jgi:hypothetical protein
MVVHLGANRRKQTERHKRTKDAHELETNSFQDGTSPCQGPELLDGIQPIHSGHGIVEAPRARPGAFRFTQCIKFSSGCAMNTRIVLLMYLFHMSNLDG